MPIPRHFVQFCFVLLLTILLSPAAHALGPKGDAFFGYSRTGSDIFYPNTGGLNGWEGALHLHTGPFLGVEGDVAHYGLGANPAVPRTTTVLFGPRVTVGGLGLKAFVHGLVGGQHSANNNGISGGAFTYAIGGGVDVPVAPMLKWRFAIDRLSAPTRSSGSGTEARFSTGLALHF
jgi:hypothetical protein